MKDHERAAIAEGFDVYQMYAETTAIYPRNFSVSYPLIGLVGEVGEFANKYKKVIRDGITLDPKDTEKELGDILWYLSNLASDLGINLEDIAVHNLEKLADRARRGVIKGSGDTR